MAALHSDEAIHGQYLKTINYSLLLEIQSSENFFLPSSSTVCCPEDEREGVSDTLLAGALELRGASVEGVGFKLFPAGGAVLIPPPVTFFGGAMATILTAPRGSDLIMASASANLFPSKLSSLMEMR